jgi:hypothetical protein
MDRDPEVPRSPLICPAVVMRGRRFQLPPTRGFRSDCSRLLRVRGRRRTSTPCSDAHSRCSEPCRGERSGATKSRPAPSFCTTELVEPQPLPIIKASDGVDDRSWQSERGLAFPTTSWKGWRFDGRRDRARGRHPSRDRCRRGTARRPPARGWRKPSCLEAGVRHTHRRWVPYGGRRSARTWREQWFPK